MQTAQVDFWSGEFGQKYTDRNTFSIEEWDQFYVDCYAAKRTEMNALALANIPKDAKILEVGCNIGMQLRGLQHQGFTNLYGIELQDYAVQQAKQHTKGINIIQGNAFDIPFKDGYFDLVFTSGVLIHIAPDDLSKVFSEMNRCSSKYIWGFEYYTPEVTNINYRGNKGFLWKADYGKMVQDQFPAYKATYIQDYPYVKENEKGNVDRMYLLEK